MKLEGPPEKIWLQYHGDADPADYPADDYPDYSEVSWCWEPIFEHDIEYIRLDKYKELEAERDRLEERLGDWQRETALAKADRDRLRDALQEYKNKYSELIMEVAQKVPNESRHETAKRYIRERESSSGNEEKAKQALKEQTD